MSTQKTTSKGTREFCNVALLPEDHKALKILANEDQRTMTRQLSVIIRKEFENFKKLGG